MSNDRVPGIENDHFDLDHFDHKTFSFQKIWNISFFSYLCRRYMNSQPDKDEAAGTVLNASLPFLKSDECEKVKGQLSYIVQDMKEEHQKSQNRGFHM